jgi:hypothetical protein
MDKLFRIFTALDWFVGGISILVGLYMQNWWVVAGGVLGLITAYFKPALIIKAKLEKKFLRKKAKTDDSAEALAEDSFYAQMLGQEAVAEPVAAEPAPALPARTYRDALPPYAGAYLSRNRHNQVAARHLPLLPETTAEPVQGEPPRFY